MNYLAMFAALFGVVVVQWFLGGPHWVYGAAAVMLAVVYAAELICKRLDTVLAAKGSQVAPAASPSQDFSEYPPGAESLIKELLDQAGGDVGQAMALANRTIKNEVQKGKVFDRLKAMREMEA